MEVGDSVGVRHSYMSSCKHSCLLSGIVSERVTWASDTLNDLSTTGLESIGADSLVLSLLEGRAFISVSSPTGSSITSSSNSKSTMLTSSRSKVSSH